MFFCFFLSAATSQCQLGSLRGELTLQSCESQTCLSPRSLDPLFLDACITKEAGPSTPNPATETQKLIVSAASRCSPVAADSSPDSLSLNLRPADPVAAAAALLWLHDSASPLGCRAAPVPVSPCSWSDRSQMLRSPTTLCPPTPASRRMVPREEDDKRLCLLLLTDLDDLTPAPHCSNRQHKMLT